MTSRPGQCAHPGRRERPSQTRARAPSRSFIRPVSLPSSCRFALSVPPGPDRRDVPGSRRRLIALCSPRSMPPASWRTLSHLLLGLLLSAGFEPRLGFPTLSGGAPPRRRGVRIWTQRSPHVPARSNRRAACPLSLPTYAGAPACLSLPPSASYASRDPPRLPRPRLSHPSRVLLSRPSLQLPSPLGISQYWCLLQATRPALTLVRRAPTGEKRVAL